MEGRAMVSYSTGPMNSLVEKLPELKTAHPEIGELLDELVSFKEGFLDKVELVSFKEGFLDKVAWQHPLKKEKKVAWQEANGARAWTNHVRELLYEIEDWVRIDVKPGSTNMVGEVEKFKKQIEQARELCTRYGLLSKAVQGGAIPIREVAIDSRLSVEQKTGLVAINDQTDELIKRIKEEKDKTLKVISIVGLEGLGKTTLAKQIYAKLQAEDTFECWAFVTVGRRPSMKATVKEILRQVKLPTSFSAQKNKIKPKANPKGGKRAPPNLQRVITKLWEYLGTKRYFILLDGLWSTRAWKVVNCALPNKNLGSRVLTTTCNSDVAKCCSIRSKDVYQMKALSQQNSRSLFLQSIQEEQNQAYFNDVSNNMLEMCDGMPLAITVAAGLLATKSQGFRELKMSGESILSSVDQYSTSEGMMNILYMSYAGLSLPLKSCFLYLSVFREDYTIKKDRLIRLWEAEGFIPKKHEERRGEETTDEEIRYGDIMVIGERYFNELIMRKLIQPVFDYNDDKAVGCTVHGVILDFIRSLSSQSNFVTVPADLSPGIFPGSIDTIRRFSLDCYNDEDEHMTLSSSTMHLSRVRSLTVLGDVEGMAGHSALTVSGEINGTPVLPSFKLIRVLDLEDTDHLRSRHLQGIRGLVLLRYLGLGGTAIDKLPEEIGELEQLETLDLRQTANLSDIPASIVNSKMLAHLLIDDTVKLPCKILKMQGLEEVSTIGVKSSRSLESVVQLLRESERLRVLGVRLSDGLQLSAVKSFLMEVARSTKLTSLSLDCLHIDLIGLLQLLEGPPSDQLKRFNLIISAPILGGDVPNMAFPVSLTHMDIEITGLEDEVVRVLGDLPNLVFLKLVSSRIHSSSGKSRKCTCIVGVDGFQHLKVFSFKFQFGGTELAFTPGAMPELQRLSLYFTARDGNFGLGIEHLPSLTRVHATINCKSATASEVKDAEAAIREKLCKSSIQPTLEFSRTFTHMMLHHKAKTTAFTKNRVYRIISSLIGFK